MSLQNNLIKNYKCLFHLAYRWKEFKAVKIFREVKLQIVILMLANLVIILINEYLPFSKKKKEHTLKNLQELKEKHCINYYKHVPLGWQEKKHVHWSVVW